LDKIVHLNVILKNGFGVLTSVPMSRTLLTIQQQNSNKTRGQLTTNCFVPVLSGYLCRKLAEKPTRG